MNKMSLDGLNVVVTRPLAQAQNLCATLERYQARVVHFPVISIAKTSKIHKAKNKLKAFAHYDSIIFISANAVYYAMSLAEELGIGLKNKNIAAIGPATKSAIENYGLHVSITPKTGFTSESLLSHPLLQNIVGKKMLIVRGHGGREKLRQVLESRGAIIDYAEVYQRQVPDQRNKLDLSTLSKHNTAILLNSTESLQNLWALCNQREREWIKDVVIVVGGKRIWESAKSAGLAKNTIISENPSDSEMLDTLLKWRNCDKNGK